MKRIRIDLDNIGQTISEIDDLIRQIEALPQALAEEAVPVAQSGYGGRVSVGAEDGNIIASSDEVGFLEYGTGVNAEYDPEAPIPTGYATWSASEDGRGILAKKGYWYYNKQKLYGTEATHAMRHTVEHLKKNGEEIAKGKIT